MKLKKVLAGVMAAVTAMGTFMGVSLSANAANSFVLVRDVAEQICERKDSSILKNGESINTKIKNSYDLYDYNSNQLLLSGWYYKIPVSSNGKVVIDITANGGSCKNVYFINSDIKNYVYKMLDDSNEFFSTQVGESCYGHILYGNKKELPKEGNHKNDDTLMYYAALQCKDYSGTFTFDVKKGTYFLAIYQDNDEEVCEATITATYPSEIDDGIGNSESVNISALTTGKISNQAYTGKALKPSVTVKDDDKKLIKGTDYTLSYKNNTKPGKATVTITGKGNYTGTKTVTFNIVPKKVRVTAKTSGANAVLSWKKSTGAAGYEVFCSENGGKFTRAATITTTKYTAANADGCKFRVRPYVIINGKKVYGKWSNTVSV